MTARLALGLLCAAAFYAFSYARAAELPDSLSLGLGGLSVALGLLGICWKGRAA